MDSSAGIDDRPLRDVAREATGKRIFEGHYGPGTRLDELIREHIQKYRTDHCVHR